jgi:hypothetical protein
VQTCTSLTARELCVRKSLRIYKEANTRTLKGVWPQCIEQEAMRFWAQRYVAWGRVTCFAIVRPKRCGQHYALACLREETAICHLFVTHKLECKLYERCTEAEI